MINVKTLKNNLTLENYRKIEKALNLREFSRNNNQIIFYNADKHKDLSRQKPKLYFYFQNRIYISYSASRSYDIIGLVQAVKTTQGEKFSFIDAINFVLSVTGLDPKACQRLTAKKQYGWEEDLGKYLKIKNGENSLQIYDKSILKNMPSIYPESWIKEGISICSMEKYGIKYYSRAQATVIPCYDKEGNLIGVRCRHWKPEEIENGKYRPLQLLDPKIIYKFPTNKVFYGINYNWAEIERTGHVILVEGEKSVLKADSWWHEKSNVLALYGSNIGLKRVKELIKMGVNHVTLALDSDYHSIDDEEYKEFENKILKLSEMFKGFCEVDVVYFHDLPYEIDSYKCSPFDFDEKVWNDLWERREVIV